MPRRSTIISILRIPHYLQSAPSTFHSRVPIANSCTSISHGFIFPPFSPCIRGRYINQFSLSIIYLYTLFNFISFSVECCNFIFLSLSRFPPALHFDVLCASCETLEFRTIAPAVGAGRHHHHGCCRPDAASYRKVYVVPRLDYMHTSI